MSDDRHPGVVEAEKHEAWQAEKNRLDMEYLLTLPQFRYFYWLLLSQCQLHRSPMTHPQESFRQIGHQDIGRWAEEKLFTANSDAYTLMLKEAQIREAEVEIRENEVAEDHG